MIDEFGEKNAETDRGGPADAMIAVGRVDIPTGGIWLLIERAVVVVQLLMIQPCFESLDISQRNLLVCERIDRFTNVIMKNKIIGIDINNVRFGKRRIRWFIFRLFIETIRFIRHHVQLW